MPDEDLPQLPSVVDKDFKEQIIDLCTPKEKPKKKSYNLIFEPTNDQRMMVFMMIATGMTEDKILLCITNPHTGKTLDKKIFDKNFAREKEIAKDYAVTAIASSLFKKALNEDGAVSDIVSERAAEFWLRTQGHWKNATDVVEHKHTGKIEFEEVGDAINQLGRLALNRLKQLGDSGVDKPVESETSRRANPHMEVLSPIDTTDTEG